MLTLQEHLLIKWRSQDRILKGVLLEEIRKQSVCCSDVVSALLFCVGFFSFSYGSHGSFSPSLVLFADQASHVA